MNEHMERIKEKGLTKTWEDYAKEQFQGLKIVNARYMTKAEAEDLGWSVRVLVLQLNDGNIIFPSCDDEGNQGGAIFTNNERNSTFPVIGLDYK